MRARRRLTAAAILVAALAAATIVLLGSHASSHVSASTPVPAGETTTTVRRRTLTESSTVDGTLGYGSTLELYDRLSGTFTWLPVVGSIVRRGGTLFRVNNLPIVLMYGSLPAYRSLEQGVSDGPDVSELNRNLIDLGFDPYGAIRTFDQFSEATAEAVRRWQKNAGLAQTGAVELGRIVFAPGARRVTELHVALGQDPPGGGTGSEEPAGRPPTEKAPVKKEPVEKQPLKKKLAKRKPNRRPASKAPASKAPASKAPAAEKPAATGDPEPAAGAGMVVLSTTSTQQIVQLEVKAEQQELAHVGESAPVTLPGGDVVRGRIVAVGSVAESKAPEKAPAERGASPSSEDESATISVTLALERPIARLDEAPVSVELVESIRRGVLTVPATALSATAGGGYAIEVLEGARRAYLAVMPGMFAAGYVQVEGAGVHEGLTVLESE